MACVLDQWKLQLRALTPGEKAELAHFLLSSLEPDDAEAEKLWDEEASRRAREVREGRARGRPVDDLLDELREMDP